MITVLTGPVIAAGESISSAVDVTKGVLASICTPMTWGPARTQLTFLYSADGIAYSDMFDADGREVSVFVQRGTAIVGIKPVSGWVKFRSGNRDAPVAQTVSQTFTTVIDTAAV